MKGTNKACHHVHSANEYVDWCLQLFRDKGGRITKSRVAVIELLAAAKEPLSAGDIFEYLTRNSSVKVDKVSVYRVLEALLEVGAVHRVSPDGRYIACVHAGCEGMYHIISRCTACQEVKEVDVPEEVVAPLLFHMKNSLQFVPDEHVLHLDGVCRRCEER